MFGSLYLVLELILCSKNILDKEPSAVDKQVPDQLVHRCLLCLGDLTRYQLELVTGPEKDRISSVSRRYYHQALLHRLDSGLPYNQLATLAADHNFGLNSVFYYLRRFKETLCSTWF